MEHPLRNTNPAVNQEQSYEDWLRMLDQNDQFHREDRAEDEEYRAEDEEYRAEDEEYRAEDEEYRAEVEDDGGELVYFNQSLEELNQSVDRLNQSIDRIITWNDEESDYQIVDIDMNLFRGLANTSEVESPCQKIMKIVFESNPDSIVYGLYVASYLRHETAMVKSLDVLWGDTVVPRNLTNKFKQNGWLEDNEMPMLRELPDSTQLIYRLVINNQIIRLILTDKLRPIERVTFRALNLTLNSRGEISRIFRQCDTISSQNEIINKQLTLFKWFSASATEDENYLHRYTRFKLIRDAIALVDQGWTLENQLDYKVYPETESSNCAICLEDVQQGHTLELKCSHLFHLNCLEDHIAQTGEGASQCPICRKNVIF